MFEAQGKLLEAHRLRQRTEYDLEMLQRARLLQRHRELLARSSTAAPPGAAAAHAARLLPVRLPRASSTSRTRPCRRSAACTRATARASRRSSTTASACRRALDNRPLRFDEFLERVGADRLRLGDAGRRSSCATRRVVAEQVIRPTGLVDPEVELRPTKNQIDDLLNEIRAARGRGERVLVTTLTKKMAEDLTDYLLEAGVKARYLHSEIDTLERIQIIRELRLGEYDVLVGVNLLREGLDLPEVSLVAILDADKEGFLRGKTALDPDDRPRGAQRQRPGAHVRRQGDRGDRSARSTRPTAAARSSSPTTRSTASRRARSSRASPTSPSSSRSTRPNVPGTRRRGAGEGRGHEPRRSSRSSSITLEEEMFAAAEELRFEYAAKLRDEIKELRRELMAIASRPAPAEAPA